MSDTDTSNPNNSEDNENPQISKSKVQAIFQELEILSVQKGLKSNLDFSRLSEKQIDRLFDLVSLRAKNLFELNFKRFEGLKEIEIKYINASVVNQITLRIVVIGLILILPLITVLILFYKENFFIPWLTFLTGLLGGIGLSKLFDVLKPKEKQNPLVDVKQGE